MSIGSALFLHHGSYWELFAIYALDRPIIYEFSNILRDSRLICDDLVIFYWQLHGGPVLP